MTSAEVCRPIDARGGSGHLVLTPVGWDDPVAATMIEAVQQVYVQRYGGRDETPVEPGEFAPPHGLFLIGRLDAEPAACGGWRIVAPGVGGDRVAELKRMYVAPAYRGRGLSRALLAALEEAARTADITTLILETGRRQPEAIRLYETSGYTPIEGFGHYRCAPESVHLGKTLC